MSSVEQPANWYPDPYGRHELRWWDPPQWTDEVCDGGVRSTDPVVTAPAVPDLPSADAGVLDATAFVVAMPEAGSGTWQTTLPVLAVEDDRPLGWVHFGKERSGSTRHAVWASLVDPAGVPLVGARTTTSSSAVGSGPIRFGPADSSGGPFHRFEILDAQATVVSSGRHSRVVNRQRVRFAQHGVEVMKLEFTHARRHQADPTTITVGGAPLGTVVQLGQRASAGPAGSWLRLDRAPGLGDPHRTFVAAAPLVLLTYIT